MRAVAGSSSVLAKSRTLASAPSTSTAARSETVSLAAARAAPSSPPDTSVMAAVLPGGPGAEQLAAAQRQAALRALVGAQDRARGGGGEADDAGLVQGALGARVGPRREVVERRVVEAEEQVCQLPGVGKRACNAAAVGRARQRSMLEGGGQILRYASALSAITGVPVAVDKVRAGRAKPGLQPQHLTGLQLVESICGGRLEGGTKGSCSIVLHPGTARCGSYTADTHTAGSCTLMLQASMPVCVFAGEAAGPDSALGPSISGRHTELELRGGTDADMAPPVGYLTDVLVPLLRNLYGDLLQGLDVRLVRRGFYPRGGGVLTARLPALPPGTPLPPLDLTTRGDITRVTIRAFAAGRQPVTVARRLAASAESAIRRVLKGMGPAGRGVPVLVEAVLEPQDRAMGDGCGVLLVAETDTGCRLGASAKGQRGVSAEEVGEQAAAELVGLGLGTGGAREVAEARWTRPPQQQKQQKQQQQHQTSCSLLTTMARTRPLPAPASALE
ncbi:RNA 3'-terminal phosphate cyclase, partial [Tetrabaena socialis]